MPKNCDLFLKGDVGSPWYGNFTSDMVSSALDRHKDSTVNVIINSLGGYTHEGLAISSLFKLHGDVHVHFIGMNASAATIAAMGARHISIDADAAFLVHKCSLEVFEWESMNADQLDALIRKLEKQKEEQHTIDTIVAGLYASRCKKPKEELLKLMSKDTWLTARQALDWGFVDEITDNPDDKAPLTEEMAAAISSAGMPLPPGFTAADKRSLLDRFLDFLRSFNHQVQNPDSDPDNSSTMDNKPVSQSQQVTTEAPQSPEPTQSDAMPTANSAATDNAVSDDRDATIADLRQQIADRDATIAQLRKMPAADTSNVVDSDKSDDPYAPVSDKEAIEASKAFLKSF